MHPESLARKKAAAEASGLRAYTVVIDRRGYAPVYYVREGLGSFYLRNMDRVSSEEELKLKIQ